MKRDVFKTYLAVINNSLGARTFRNFYVIDNSEEIDAMEDGVLSCAFFVSGLLKMFDLIKGIHGTVDATVTDLEESGWQKIDKPVPGAIIVWENKVYDDGESHGHIGFYAGDGLAISNSTEKGHPVRHDWQFEGKRKAKAIYWKEIA